MKNSTTEKKVYNRPEITEIGHISQFINAFGDTPPTDGVITGPPGMRMVLVQPFPPS